MSSARPANPPAAAEASATVPLVYALSVVIGLTAAVGTFGWDAVLDGQETMRSIDGDPAASLAGFRYYLADEWRWPLLYTERLSAPDGTVIAFTDSIPLLALVAKALRGLGITPDQWWSWWLAGTFVGQSVGTVFVLRSWGVKAMTTVLPAAVVVTMFPPFLYRHLHLALAMHGVLLFSIGLGVRMRQGGGRGLLWSSGSLLVVALLIHPYHLITCGVVLVGCTLDGAREGRWRPRELIAAAAGSAAAVGLVAWSGGYFDQDTTLATGYGLYSLIPYSPVWPQESVLWPGDEQLLNISGSVEGFAYFGAGGLLIAAIGLALVAGKVRPMVAGSASLVLGLVTLLAYAVTYKVSVRQDDPIDLGYHLAALTGSPSRAVTAAGIGAFVLGVGLVVVRHRYGAGTVQWTDVSVHAAVVLLVGGVVAVAVPSLLETVVGTFRASGRMAWPAWYLVILGSVVLMSRRLDQRVVAGVLVVAAVLQVVDTGEHRQVNQPTFRADAERVEHLEAMSELMSLHEDVSLKPHFVCTAYPVGVYQFIDVMAASSSANARIDTAYVARGIENPCEDRLGPAAGPSDPDTLLISANPALILPDDVSCRVWSDQVTACSAHWDLLSVGARAAFDPLEPD